MMFASDFSGLMPILIGIPAVAIALGFLSLILAHRGHWSCLLLAIPCVPVGGIFALSLSQGGLGFFYVLFLAPLIIGVASIWLWVVRFIDREAAKEKSRT